jgi:very-short-patch-repair endonuclease
MNGVYLELELDELTQEKAQRVAWLNRAGPGAALSGATAAVFHQLDSTKGWSPLTNITQNSMNEIPRTAGVQFCRSRTLSSDQRVFVNGLFFTSRMRTLVDVLAPLDLVEGERVLESALRGPDPKRPDVWRENELGDLVQFINQHLRQPGAQQARILLTQRPAGCRPTGSIAETAALQALRNAGLGEIIRQPLVRAPDENGNPRDHFLDLFLANQRIDIEVDGGDHLERKRRQADLERDRRLSLGIAVVRVTAVEALHHPDRVVNIVRDAIARRHHEARNYGVGSLADLVGANHHWEIVRRSAAA